MAVTLRTIADEVGMTTMTVSYALRGSPQVSKETRAKVLAVAKRLGYRPNASARATRSGRFDCKAVSISLIATDVRAGQEPGEDLPVQVDLGRGQWRCDKLVTFS